MDPITAGALSKGAAKVGAFAIDWAKGPPAQRLAAALGARLEEGDFQIFSFKTLDNDERYWDLIEQWEQTYEFDESRATEILHTHVHDMRGDKETAEAIARVVALMRPLLTQVAKGGSPALASATALQHQDHLEAMGELRRLRSEVAGFQAGSAQPKTRVIAFDRTWVSGRRAKAAWSKLIDRDAETAAELKEALGDRPTAATVRAYLLSATTSAADVWEVVVHITDEFGDWKLLEEVSLRYAEAEGADQPRGLGWAAGGALLSGDTAGFVALLERAEELEPAHPSIGLVRARGTSDPAERLRILDTVEPRDDEQRLALEGARALAHLELGERDAAFAALKRAQALDADDLLASEVEASLIVREVIDGKVTNWQAGAKAVDDLERVRARLVSAERFDLSAEIAGKIAQVYLLFGDARNVRAVAEQLDPAERGRDEVAMVAATLLAVGDAELAIEVLPDEPKSDYARFVFASALMKVEKARFRSEGIAILDELLDSTDPQIQVEAAWIRAGAALLDDPPPPSDKALALLREHDPVRALLYEAELADDPAEASRILETGGEMAELLIERGRVAEARGDSTTALDLFQRATSAEPTAVNKLALAHSLREAGDGASAKEKALEVARSDSNSPGIRKSAYGLAYGLTQRHGDVEAQVALGQEWANALEPEPRLLWSLTWGLVQLARYEDAKSILERYSLEPEDDDAATIVADVLAHTVESAEEQLRQLLELADRFDHEIPAVEFRIMTATLAADEAKADNEVMKRGVKRLQSFHKRYPDAMLEMEIDPADPLRHIQPMLEERAQAVQTVARGVTTGDLPFAALAAATGRDIGSLVLGVNILPLGYGSAELDALELEDARAALGGEVVVDSFAVNVAGGLGLAIYKKVQLAFKKVVVPQAVVDDLRGGAYDATSPVATATLGFDPDSNRVFYHESDEAERAREECRAKAILGLIDGFSVEPNVVSDGAGPIEKWVSDEGHLDHPTLATAEVTLAVAERTGYTIYSDDRAVRLHARRSGLRAFGTPVLLAAMAEKGMLDADELAVAVRLLLRTGAQGVPVTMFDALEDARDAGWDLTFASRAFLLDHRRWNEEFDLNLRRWLDFLRVVKRDAPDSAFSKWVFRVADAATLALPQAEPLEVLTAVALNATFTETSDEERDFRMALLDELERVRFQHNVRESVRTSVGRRVRLEGGGASLV
jgi:tetratricopeptide (TPR) repeat protein